MKQAHRFSGPGKPYAGLTKLSNGGPVWTGEVRTVPKNLDQPLRWRKPRRVFVDSMSDLFHEAVPDEFIFAVLGVAALTPHHTFQILTKRAERMHDLLTCFRGLEDAAVKSCVGNALSRIGILAVDHVNWTWPLPNVWLGVSAEDQARLDERVPLLLQTPAAVRWVSAEPLLGPLDFAKVRAESYRTLPDEPPLADMLINALSGQFCGAWHGRETRMFPGDSKGPCLDWIVVGGESGPGARRCDVAWIRDIIRQCGEAGTAVFVKQLGARPISEGPFNVRQPGIRDRKGKDPAEWPEDLRVRDWPS